MAKKWALLVGCNYTNNPKVTSKLHGCINDVKAMHALIRQPRFGFHNNEIKILTDETDKKPTFENITHELEKLIGKAGQGDTLLFYFSGGGALVNPQDTNVIIPVIVPCDLKPIAGAHILPIIKPLPDKAILTFIFDSSYSGGLFQQNDPNQSNVAVNVQNFGSKTIPLQPLRMDVKVHPFNNGILFTSSKSNEESVEVYLNGDKSKAFSAYSSAIQAMFNSPEAVNPPEGKTNSAVEKFMEKLLSTLKFTQHPYHKYSGNNANALFLGGYVARG